MITAFLIISIILSLALVRPRLSGRPLVLRFCRHSQWVQPPNITVSNPAQNSTQSVSHSWRIDLRLSVSSPLVYLPK